MQTKELRIKTRYEATTFQSDVSLRVQNSSEQQPFGNGFLKFVNFSAVISWGCSNQNTEEQMYCYYYCQLLLMPLQVDAISYQNIKLLITDQIGDL